MNMEQDFLVSIVVPVYNVEPYLRRCVDSLIHQTYSNIEVILVDDGSTDGSAEVCEEYNWLDERIKVIHKPHGGVTGARKAGVATASGEYIGLVDGDDWVEPFYCKELVQAVRASHADCIAFGFWEDSREESILRLDSVDNGFYDREAIKKSIYPILLYNPVSSESGIYPSVCTKLVKAPIIKRSQQMVPDEISFGEDQVCVAQTLELAESIYVTDLAPYHYARRDSSMSAQPYDIKKCAVLLRELNAIYERNPILGQHIGRLYEYAYFILLLKRFDLFLSGKLEGVPFGRLSEAKVALYGAGVLGREIYQKLEQESPGQIVVWVDRAYEKYCDQLPVEPVDTLLHREYDWVLVAITDVRIAQNVQDYLNHMGIEGRKIRLLATPSEEFFQKLKEILFTGEGLPEGVQTAAPAGRSYEQYDMI